MNKVKANQLAFSTPTPAQGVQETPLSGSYLRANTLNKFGTFFRILFRATNILFEETIQFVIPRRKAAQASNKPRNFSNTIFKLGLSVTGTKLSHRFDFKTKYCRERQLKLLREILEENKDTEFGREHNFAKINSVEDFQRNVSVNTYDTLSSYITRHTHGEENVLIKENPISYATTSGTTGDPKFIPITETAQRESHQNVSRIFVYSIFKEIPEAFDGTILTIVSPAEEGRTPDGTIFGSTSGQLIQGLNNVIKKKYTIPYEVLTLESYEARNYCIILLGIMNPVSMLSTANPSTLSLLGKKGNEWKDALLRDVAWGTLRDDLVMPTETRKLVEERLRAHPELANELKEAIANDSEGKLRPLHYWKSLKVITCWTGGNSHVFLRDMREWFGEIPVRDLGYLASEVRGTIPLRNAEQAGVLTIGENFFEFVKVGDIDDLNPRYYMAHEIEKGERYYIFFTTKAGLYRYNINDIVEVQGFSNNTPRVIFVQKGKGVTNITGEKLYEQQLLTAIEETEKETGNNTRFFMGVAMPEKSRYELFAEFDDQNLSIESQQAFLQGVEGILRKNNMEYDVKRKSQRLEPMILKTLASDSLDTFKTWRVAQGIREAQFKTVPLTSDAGLLEPLTITNTIEQ